MNQEKRMNKVYLPNFDNGMSYSDHSDITYGKVYMNIEDAINFMKNSHEGDYGEIEPYVITKENHFNDNWHKNYSFGEIRLPYLFQPDVSKLPEYDYRREMNYENINDFAYIEVLEVE